MAGESVPVCCTGAYHRFVHLAAEQSAVLVSDGEVSMQGEHLSSRLSSLRRFVAHLGLHGGWLAVRMAARLAGHAGSPLIWC